jgi:dihydroneopterin aldolase
MDQLIIQDLAVLTHIGVNDWEQRILQPVLLDIHIQTDFNNCQDKLENVLNYDALCQSVTRYVESQTFLLIETLANATANFIKEEFKLDKVTLSLSKPNAIKNAKNVKVIVTR